MIFMGILDRLLGKRLFKPQADDVKMWQAARASHIDPSCDCLAPQYGGTFGELNLHSEVQNTECDAWKLLESLVEAAAAKRSREFTPGLEMPPELWSQIITLPPSIAKLTSVRRLYLYNSHLMRIPPEIGAMENLEDLDLYTSYRLHWVPFEVTRCQKLKRSRVSTRAIYGNYKYRPPFPRLANNTSSLVSGNCSVCRQSFSLASVVRVWISLRVGTDVLPLLVNACSERCVGRLPPPAKGYVDRPHTGGLELVQPPTEMIPPDRIPRGKEQQRGQ
jgi:hypothetical protein